MNREELAKLKNPYAHKVKVFNDVSKCIAKPLAAPCAMDYCLKKNGLPKCPAIVEVCQQDCPACVWDKAVNSLQPYLDQQVKKVNDLEASLSAAVKDASHQRDLKWMGRLIDAGVPVMNSPEDVPDTLYTQSALDLAVKAERERVVEVVQDMLDGMGMDERNFKKSDWSRWKALTEEEGK